MGKRVIRVFPRRTKATPDDEFVRIGGPTLFDEADEVLVSVAFDWDKPKAEQIADDWRRVTSNVSIGGPAYDDHGDEFIPGKFLKKGHLITSRGCPNQCWFCEAWRNEGNKVREYPIHEGFIIHDNNLIATSRAHQEAVFNMLLNQKERPRFTGGIEAKRLTEWHANWFVKLRPKTIWFAYDEPADYEPLIRASVLLRDAGLFTKEHICMCYVLIGYEGDTIADAEKRLIDTIKLGFMPQAMLFNKKHDDWYWFQRKWASRIIVGTTMRQLKMVSVA